MAPGARVIITLYTGRLREGTAGVALVLDEHTATSLLSLHLLHADGVIFFLTPEALLA